MLWRDPTHQVVVDGAGQEPVSNIVGHHFSCSAGAGGKTDCVCVVVLRRQDLAMEMDWMGVHLVLKDNKTAKKGELNKHINTFSIESTSS